MLKITIQRTRNISDLTVYLYTRYAGTVELCSLSKRKKDSEGELP